MNRGVSIALLIAAGACLWAAGTQNQPLVEMRSAYHLDVGEPLNNAPPVVTFTTVVLGGFRGILTDILWLRASCLQDEGKYFELLQLSDWITKLEPRCSEIWAFHAWNMAYNISVMMSEAADRWRWVRNGFQLLRDEGIRYNPRDADLCWELGWIFQNKIGGATDQAHRFYQQEWAREMTDLLGGPHPDYARLQADPEARARMRHEYKLDPETMQKLDTAYGPLDWRLPSTHALYWAWIGSQCATAKTSLPCDRLIYQAMADSFRRGRLVFRPAEGVYETAPYPEILPNVLKAFDHAVAKHPDPSVRTAYLGFMQHAASVLHSLNKDDEALRLIELMKTKFPADMIADYESRPPAPAMAP